jgi:hypothetical protein
VRAGPRRLGVCAGIDLLGKFLAGNDLEGGVRKRFTKFLTTYFGISQNDADTIYQLRNSLLHSFGLYSKRKGKVVRFVLFGGPGTLISPSASESDTYLINIEILRTEFENALT